MRLACLTLLLLVAGCAPLISASSPQVAGPSSSMAAVQEAQKMALASRAAQDEAEKGCEPQRTRTPGFAEERAIGHELAISRLAGTGHLSLDGATETDSAKLKDDLAARKPFVLPEGKKNAVSIQVAIVGRNLARYSSRPDLPWVFAVIENDAAFSFSEPGGFVFITTGLLKKLTNEAQLAGVLGHEISHVVKKDTLKQYISAVHKQCIAAKYAEAMIKQGGLNGPAVESMAQFARQFDGPPDFDRADPGFKHFLMSAVMSFSMMGSDKATEFAHDQAALELLSFAGYDATEYEKFLASTPMPNHPPGAERATKLQALREGELKDFATGTAKPDLSKLLAP